MAGVAAVHSKDFVIVNRMIVIMSIFLVMYVVGPQSAVNKVSDYIYMSDNRSRVASLIHSRFYIFMEIGVKEVLRSRAVVSYKRKHVHEVLVNC